MIVNVAASSPVASNPFHAGTELLSIGRLTRHHVVLGPSPNPRGVTLSRPCDHFTAKYVQRDSRGRLVPTGSGVPRGAWVRIYPRSICGSTTAYFVPGAMATPADFAEHRRTA
eukprot:2018521-Prymnesium_polylepis.2